MRKFSGLNHSENFATSHDTFYILLLAWFFLHAFTRMILSTCFYSRCAKIKYVQKFILSRFAETNSHKNFQFSHRQVHKILSTRKFLRIWYLHHLWKENSRMLLMTRALRSGLIRPKCRISVKKKKSFVSNINQLKSGRMRKKIRVNVIMTSLWRHFRQDVIPKILKILKIKILL